MNKTFNLFITLVLALLIFVTDNYAFASDSLSASPMAGAQDGESNGLIVGIIFVLSLWFSIRAISNILEWDMNGYERIPFFAVMAAMALLWAAYTPWYGIIFAGLAVVIFFADENRRADFAKCRAIIEEHGRELAIKKKQLVVPRGYGLKDESGWEKEKAFFLDTLVYTPVGRCTKIESFQEKVSDLFDEIVGAIDIKSADMNKNITPREYEQYVAEVLREHGWDAHATKGARDQGIDVVASQNGKKVVIQCKLYSNSVGNAAVQEIIAGREFIKADFAAVVSNIKYTLPAKQLAASSGVLLLHDAELPELYSMLFNSSIN